VLRMPRGTTHDGAAVKARDYETEREPSLESNLSDWAIQYNRSGPQGLEFYPFRPPF